MQISRSLLLQPADGRQRDARHPADDSSNAHSPSANQKVPAFSVGFHLLQSVQIPDEIGPLDAGAGFGQPLLKLLIERRVRKAGRARVEA